MKLIATMMTLLLLSTGVQAQTRPASRRITLPRAIPAQPSEASVQQLPIRRVILYSNGVAYVERRGLISGHAEISLSFKQSQVDDVLKSMVVLDLGRGRIGAVSYNSSAPPSARLAEIPFSIEAGTAEEEGASGGLAGVLRQLQGARVVVTAANRAATGAILTVEERRAQIAADKPPHVTHSLVIASEAGEIASFDLAEVRSVKLVDEVAKRDINQFANVSASARRRDAKTIVVTSDGDGAREMLVSYTVAAPIWKTTYRVVLDSTGQPFFQGWAIVDNVSEEDWADVKLSLISGTPVSFIQPIQRPLYRYRPVIPIPEDLNLDPQVYEAALDGVTTSMVGVGGGGPGGSGGGGRVDAPVVHAENDEVSPPSPTPAGRSFMKLSDAITSDDSSVRAAARGSEVGDLFQYSIDQPVTVPRDRSALIPILQTRMEGERVSIYNESARRERPMSGLRLKNTSALTLEDGSLTVIDGDAYAGEALIERLKPGEDRFISFALDLGTLVDSRLKNGREPVFLVRVINGDFQAHYYQSEQKTYTVVNQTERPRVLYIEHPRRDGWTLSRDTPAPAEVTASAYRFRLELAPHQRVELPVNERRALMDTYALTNLTTDDLAVFVSQRYLDDAARDALSRIIDLKRRIAETDARLGAMEKEIAGIGEDQERLRENIKALGTTAEARALIARYIQKAGEQETRIEQLTAERQRVSAERARLQAELDNSIRTLSLERKL